MTPRRAVAIASVIVASLSTVLVADAAVTSAPPAFVAEVMQGQEDFAEGLAADGKLMHRYGRVLVPTSTEWSEDGSTVAWVASAGVTAAAADGSWQRVVYPSVLSCTPKMTSTVGCPEGPNITLSPDGRTVIVGYAGARADRLVAVSIPSGAVRNIAPPRVAGYVVESWSPDGHHILVWDNGRPRACIGGRVLIATPDLRNRRQLLCLRDRHDGPYPSWSPDSRKIAFVTEGRDDPSAGVIDAATGHLTAFPGIHPSVFQLPGWSPDSRTVAFAQYDGPVVTVTPPSTARHSTATRGGEGVWYGSKLLITAGAKVLEVRPGHSPRPLFRLPHGQSFWWLYVR